jgi:hypothetical protein
MAISVVAPEWLVWVVIAGVVVLLVVAFGYSYLVWRDDPNRTTGLANDAPESQRAKPPDTP